MNVEITALAEANLEEIQEPVRHYSVRLLASQEPMAAEVHRNSDVPVRLALRPDHPPARCDLRSRLPRLRQPEHQEHPLARTDRFRCPHERSVPAHVLHDSRHLSLHPGRMPQPYQRLERARESVAQPPAVALPPLTAHATLISS